MEPIQTPSLQDKLKALLLNKVRGLNWNYFDLDFEDFKKHYAPTGAIAAANSAISWQHVLNWFATIEYDHVHYSWKGTPQPTTEIIYYIVRALQEDLSLLKEVFTSLHNNKNVENKSEAAKGNMGNLNALGSLKRNKIFYTKLKNGFLHDDKNIIILAEGDSWILFPKIKVFGITVRDFVKDIGDYLLDRKEYALYNLAYAGDWFSNIFYEGTYLKDLDDKDPDVFLISGGGNDLASNKRIKQFVHSRPVNLANNIPFKLLLQKRENSAHKGPGYDSGKLALGYAHLKPTFIDFINLLFIQYLALFISIYKNTAKFNKMLTITQGYDYSIPANTHGKWYAFAEKLFHNFAIGEGIWLYNPLQEKGITDSKTQQAITHAMVYEINEMLLLFARTSFFGNVAHIDNRGVAKTKADWFDELHLTSATNKKVADKYIACIDWFSQHGKSLAGKYVWESGR